MGCFGVGYRKSYSKLWRKRHPKQTASASTWLQRGTSCESSPVFFSGIDDVKLTHRKRLFRPKLWPWRVRGARGSLIVTGARHRRVCSPKPALAFLFDDLENDLTVSARARAHA